MEQMMSAATMIAQVESLPAMIRSEFERFDSSARLLLNHDQCFSIKRIIITGCGDSYMAGLAAELAFEQLAGISTEPMNAMQAGRYGSQFFDQSFPRNPLVIGISASGLVARTREAVGLARGQGILTVALTGNLNSPLARAAEMTFDCGLPAFAPAPGVRTYRASLLALYLLAIRFAEVRGRLTQDEANDMRATLKGTADAIEATIYMIAHQVRALAEAVSHHSNIVFVGDGPNYATALFGAAKVIEAAGRHAMGQDTEEWAHLQYFVNTDPSTPTFVISPGGRGHDRATELIASMKQVGRTVVAVVPQSNQAIGPNVTWWLPVVGSVPEIFTPMVYPVAAELFAAHLADILGETPFRGLSGVYQSDSNIIQNSAVVQSLAL
jgi:glucosamine--fructose-6-phosphate aminotransferase (isomerizing)